MTPDAANPANRTNSRLFGLLVIVSLLQMRRAVARPVMVDRFAWVLILIVDASFIAWGGMAAVFLDHLLGPGGKMILPAGYEGFTRGSWSDFVGTFPMAAKYTEVMYRMYGLYCAIFGLMGAAIAVTAFRRGERWAWWTLLIGNTLALLSAMTMDWMVNAIGPFEVTEHLGLAMVWVAFAATFPRGSLSAAPQGAPG